MSGVKGMLSVNQLVTLDIKQYNITFKYAYYLYNGLIKLTVYEPRHYDNILYLGDHIIKIDEVDEVYSLYQAIGSQHLYINSNAVYLYLGNHSEV